MNRRGPLVIGWRLSEADREDLEKASDGYGQPIPKAIVHFNMASHEIGYRQRLALE